MDESINRPVPITARDVTRILARRAPIIVVTFLLVVAGVLALTSRQHKLYEAQASVLLDAPATGNGVNVDGINLGRSSSTPIDTEIAKIQSVDFLRKVIRDAKLGAIKPLALRGMLTVGPGPSGQILMIGARASTAELAQRIANTVANEYIAQALEEFGNKSQYSAKLLTQTRDKAEKDKLAAEAELKRFVTRVGITQPTLLFTSEANRTNATRTLLEDAQKMLPLQEKSLAKLQETLKTLPKEIVLGYGVEKTDLINSYRDQISTLETQKKDLAQDFAADSPEVQNVEAQIENRKQALADAQKNVYSKGSQSVGLNPDYTRIQSQIIDAEIGIAASRKSIDSQTQQLAALEAEQRRLFPLQIEYEKLQRARDDANSQYEKARSGLLQLSVSGNSTAPYNRVLDAADLPLFPISPKPVLNMVLALFAGLLLGLMAGLATEYFAGGFEHEAVIEDLPTVGGVPLLGRLPAGMPALASLTSDEPQGQMTARGGADGSGRALTSSGWAFEDALREIGYYLTHRDVKDPVPVVLLTSVRSGDATAKLAAQLTATLVRDGMRVTLVDGDRDNPRLNHFFGAPDAPGLTDVLENRTKLKDAMHVGVNGALRFLAAGSPMSEPTAASEERLRSVFKELAGDGKATDVVFVSGPTVWNARQIAPLEKAARGMVLLTFADSGSPDESVARVRRLLSNGYKPGLRGVIVEQPPVGSALTSTNDADLAASRGETSSLPSEGRDGKEITA